MLHQSVGRSQRQKAFTIKRAVQIILLLVVAVWLLYQIQISHSKSKNYSINSANKISKKVWTVDLGRKGNAGSNDEEAENDGNDTGGGSKEDGGDGDDELDRNAEENISQESLLKGGHEDSDENTTSQDVKGEETKDQQDELKSNEEESSDAHVKDGGEAVGEKLSNAEKNVKDGGEAVGEKLSNAEKNVNHNEEKQDENDPVKQKDSDLNADENNAFDEEKGDEKDTEKQADEVEDNERNSADNQKSDGNEAANSDKDEDSKPEATPHTDKESTTVNPPTGTEADNFHDENGIPSDGFESVNETAVTNIDEEPILGINNKTLHGKETVPEEERSSDPLQTDGGNVNVTLTDKAIMNEDVKSDDSGNASEEESASNSSQTGIMSDTNGHVEASSEIGDAFDKSSIKHGILDTMQENGAASEDSSSVSSLEKQDDVSTLKMLQTENNTQMSQ